MRIGELERLSGASRHTLRYYESVGLISAQRGDNNYRDSTNKTLGDLAFIQQAQGMGFSLGEISEILHAQRQQQLDCAQGVVLVSKKLAQVEQRIADLRHEKTRLQASVAAQHALAKKACGHADFRTASRMKGYRHNSRSQEVPCAGSHLATWFTAAG